MKVVAMNNFRAKTKDAFQRIFPKDPKSVRVLANRPKKDAEGRSAKRLNAIAHGMSKCDKYLEIGVAQGLTLEQVRVAEKTGVDPSPQFDESKLPKGVTFHRMESDLFFYSLPSNAIFDLVFLDGLHEWKQTYSDLINSLHHCHEDSVILVDDVVPDDELSAFPDWNKALEMKDAAGIFDGRWQGDVFKVLIAMAQFHPELDVFIVGKCDGVDNPQAIVTMRPNTDPKSIQKVEDSMFKDIDNLSYSDVFYDQEYSHLFVTVTEQDGFARLTSY